MIDIILLIQAIPIPTSVPWDSSTVSIILQLIVIPSMINIHNRLKKVEEKIVELSTILIGASGTNGLNSRVQRLERRGLKEDFDGL